MDFIRPIYWTSDTTYLIFGLNYPTTSTPSILLTYTILNASHGRVYECVRTCLDQLCYGEVIYLGLYWKYSEENLLTNVHERTRRKGMKLKGNMYYTNTNPKAGHYHQIGLQKFVPKNWAELACVHKFLGLCGSKWFYTKGLGQLIGFDLHAGKISRGTKSKTLFYNFHVPPCPIYWTNL